MKLQSKLGISDRKTKLAANFLRVALGKSSVERGLELKMIDTNHKLDGLFTLEKIKVKEKNQSKESTKEIISGKEN